MKYIYNSGKSSYKFTKAMKESIEGHFDKLEKYLSDEPIKATLSKEGETFILKCQVVSALNKRIRSELRGEDFYQLVTESRDAIEKQLKKKKAKSYWKERIKREEFGASEFEDESIFKRTKHFILDSILPEEAVDELESKGYDWYAFRDADNNDKVTVVYRRFDNTFGIVELD